MFDSDTPPLMVSILAAARMLGISRSKLYLLIDEDEIQVIKIGRRALVARECLMAFVDRKKKAS